MSPQRFDELVSDALDLIPDQLAKAMDNVVVLVADRNAEEPDLLGLYEGVALTERDSWYAAGSLPDTITIYRGALLEVCDSEAQVVEEVFRECLFLSLVVPIRFRSSLARYLRTAWYSLHPPPC